MYIHTVSRGQTRSTAIRGEDKYHRYLITNNVMCAMLQVEEHNIIDILCMYNVIRELTSVQSGHACIYT